MCTSGILMEKTLDKIGWRLDDLVHGSQGFSRPSMTLGFFWSKTNLFCLNII